MPIYEFKCTCGQATDIMLRMSDEIPKSIPCSACEGSARRVFHAPNILGVMPSKPFVSGGQEFTSNASAKAYQEANPNERNLERSSPEFQSYLNSVRERVDAKVKGMGFRDRKHYSDDRRHARDTGSKTVQAQKDGGVEKRHGEVTYAGAKASGG